MTEANQELTQVIGTVLCTLTTWRPAIERAMIDADVEPSSIGDFLADLAETLIHLQPDEGLEPPRGPGEVVPVQLQ